MNPEISGNDIADEMEAESGDRRKQLVFRMCKLMGWEYSQSPVLTVIRKVATTEAVAIGIDKLEEIANALEGRNPHLQITEQELTERFYQIKQELVCYKRREELWKSLLSAMSDVIVWPESDTRFNLADALEWIAKDIKNAAEKVLGPIWIDWCHDVAKKLREAMRNAPSPFKESGDEGKSNMNEPPDESFRNIKEQRDHLIHSCRIALENLRWTIKNKQNGLVTGHDAQSLKVMQGALDKAAGCYEAGWKNKHPNTKQI